MKAEINIEEEVGKEMRFGAIVTKKNEYLLPYYLLLFVENPLAKT